MYVLAPCSRFWHTFFTFWQLVPIQDLLLVMRRFKLRRLKIMTWSTTMPHQWRKFLKTLEGFHISARKVFCKKRWWVVMIATNPPSSLWTSQGKLDLTREWRQWTQLPSSMSWRTSTLPPHFLWHQWKRPWWSTSWALNQVVNTILKCPYSYMVILRQHQVLYQLPKEKVARRFLAISKVYRRTNSN